MVVIKKLENFDTTTSPTDFSNLTIPPKYNLKQSKICVEDVSHDTHNKLQVIRYVAGGGDAGAKAQAAFLSGMEWPQNETIKISFGQVDFDELAKRGLDLDPPQPFYNDLSSFNVPLDPLCPFVLNEKDPRISIKKVVEERIQKIVNLKFVYVDNFNDGDIRIDFKNDGAWSYIGKDIRNKSHSGEATMNFGWIDAPTIIHEFGHALALIHEHQNPKKGIPWDEEKVYSWAKQTQDWDKDTTKTNIIDKYAVNQINGSIYDPESIMLYYYPSKLTKDNCCGTNMNCKLSSTDVRYIHKKYGKGAPMTPEEFYLYAYNEPLKPEKESFSHPKNSHKINCYSNRCLKTVKENFSILESKSNKIIFMSLIFAFLMFYCFLKI